VFPSASAKKAVIAIKCRTYKLGFCARILDSSVRTGYWLLLNLPVVELEGMTTASVCQLHIV